MILLEVGVDYLKLPFNRAFFLFKRFQHMPGLVMLVRRVPCSASITLRSTRRTYITRLILNNV